MPNISLQAVDENKRRSVAALECRGEQRAFVASGSEIMALACVGQKLYADVQDIYADIASKSAGIRKPYQPFIFCKERFYADGLQGRKLLPEPLHDLQVDA